MKIEQRTTSFGQMTTATDLEGMILWEQLIFEREGRGHEHDLWENCWVKNGCGWIMIGEEKVYVTRGQWCHIPPQTNHWMIPEKPGFEIVLHYSKKRSSKLPEENVT